MHAATSGKIPKGHDALAILGISRLKLRDLGYIVFRNVFLLINGIILAVVTMLFAFGDRQAALFLGIITAFNIIAGLTQDINAWLALEKLQLLTAPRVLRLNADGSAESVLVEEIAKGDRIQLKVGDQVPSDSKLVEANSFEINEGLITGESDSDPRAIGDLLLAGSVVTSGTGVVIAESVFHESRIARMTEGIKKYSVNLSPIQRSINLVVKYAGYLLLLVIAFIVFRGHAVHEPILQVINNVGALTSVLVPAGLVFATTLLFAYGAAHLFRRQVLLQEVNATEKLGRIKNLCMDKTGTLTENILTVENIYLPNGKFNIERAKELMSAYLKGTNESSQTMEAVKKFIQREYAGEIAEALNFSSWRQYGGVKIKGENAVLVGSPDIFLPQMSAQDAGWIQAMVAEHAPKGKRVLCLATTAGNSLPHDLKGVSLELVAAFVFYNNLRAGIRDAINFFQERGVHIRIISGDNPETVRAVAAAAAVKDTDRVVTGKEMAQWSQADFAEKAKDYSVFARIVPEQKEKIIEALKRDGFTAMVGDGANDALAIKKADLGIAMFDGAPATRQLASVVLMNNSFTALPGGVELADSIIKNTEIFASIFLNASFIGFFLFLLVSLWGYAYPLTTLNAALINYFIIGLPGLLISYWAIRPSGKAHSASNQPFLGRILPFAVSSAVAQALGLAAIFLISPDYLKKADSNILLIVAFIAVGFIFFLFAPKVYRGAPNPGQAKQFFWLGVLEFVVLYLVIKIPLTAVFFNIEKIAVPFNLLWEAGLIIFLSGLAQFGLARALAPKDAIINV